MGSRTKSVRTFDTVQVRELPAGGFVVSAVGGPERAFNTSDIAAFDDIEGVLAWFDGAAEPGEGFTVNL